MLRFRVKTLLVVMVVAALVATAAHWIWVRPSARELAYQRQQLELLEKLSNVPAAMGDWEALPTVAAFSGEGHACLERQYLNRKTGDQIKLLIFAGHFRSVVRITCMDEYRSYKESEGIHRIAIGKSEEPFEFRVFATQGEQPCKAWVWTMTKDGRWEAPESPRTRYGYCPLLYKMYFITEHSDDEPVSKQTEDAVSLSSELADELIPAVNEALFDRPKSIP